MAADAAAPDYATNPDLAVAEAVRRALQGRRVCGHCPTTWETFPAACTSPPGAPCGGFDTIHAATVDAIQRSRAGTLTLSRDPIPVTPAPLAADRPHQAAQPAPQARPAAPLTEPTFGQPSLF
jgi:hypothetical protein